MNSIVQEDKPHPHEKANVFSKVCFLYTRDLFKKGYQGVLGLHDVCNPLEQHRAKFLGDRLEESWNEQLADYKRLEKEPSLLKALFRTFKNEYLLMGITASFEVLLLSISPWLLGELLQFFRTGTNIDFTEALIVAGTLIFIDFCKHVIQICVIFGCLTLSGKARIAISTLIYRKALRLSLAAFSETSTGHIMNYIANDLTRFDNCLRNSIYIWFMTLGFCLILYFLYLKSGIAGFWGLLAVIIIIPLQILIGNISVMYRLQASMKSGERVRLIDEIVSGIEVIKMYAWEKPFNILVDAARKVENKFFLKSSYFRDTLVIFPLFSPRIALYCTIIAMFHLGYPVEASNVYVVFPFYYLLSDKLVMSVKGVSDFRDVFTTLRRIQTYLTLPEYINVNNLGNSNGKESMLNESINRAFSNSLDGEFSNQRSTHDEDKDYILTMNNLTVKYKVNSSENILEDINLKFEVGKLYIVIGTVGSGKSSLLASILGEITAVTGHVTCKGQISYASQGAWVFGDTVKHNILFGQEYDQLKYNQIVDVCCLKQDFKQLPQGDQTIVAEKGAVLSGGQKARINLARAVYREYDIYLLDDPLSAVDTHVGKRIFHKCIMNYLRGKTRILVTHQVQYIKEVDGIILVDKGTTRFYSNYVELLENHEEYRILIAVKEDEEMEHQSNIKVAEVLDNGTTNLLDTESKDFSRKLEDIIQEDKDNFNRESLLLDFFKEGSNYFSIFLMCFLFLFTQVVVISNDLFVYFIVATETSRHECHQFSNKTKSNSSTSSGPPSDLYSRNTLVCIYSVLITSILVFGLMRSSLFSFLAVRSSKKLHDRAFKCLINTKLKFFHDNPSGRIMDRFSTDVGVTDELLPRVLIESIQMICLAIGALFIVCLMDYLFIIVATLILIACYFSHIVYKKTCSILGPLQCLVRAPVLTHINETLNGVATIRAYNAEKSLEVEFEHFLDLSSAVWFHVLSCRGAYAFAVRILTLITISIITYSFVLQRDSFNGSQAGLAITQLYCMTGFASYGVILLKEIEDYLHSVGRLLQYKNLLPEDPVNDEGEGALNSQDSSVHGIFSSLTWPSEGRIELTNVSLRYVEEDEPVLKNLNFVIEPEEKVGIVGRTGAGKSSLISAIFRLTDIEGSIKIDGIDTSTVLLRNLRSRVSIIPQDPVLFTGTMRDNLDPFHQFSDDDIWEALDKVELKAVILSSYNGLDSEVSDKGSNFSVGQRQLVCLARAILRKNRILVLDEATANVDPQTDALIQKTIRTKFHSCTVLTVAHRLNTIIDSDRVMVMSNGVLVEFDPPFKLLQDETSLFYKLVVETGDAMFNQLYATAEQYFNDKHKNCS